jgi:hypothetical protein
MVTKIIARQNVVNGENLECTALLGSQQICHFHLHTEKKKKIDNKFKN